MSETRSPHDFAPGEIALAFLCGIAVQVGLFWALRASNVDRLADAPEIDRSTVAVQVKPMLDLESPLLKLGGKRDKMRLPDRWVKQAPKPRVEERAFVSTKAEKTVEAIPSKEVPLADAGTEPPPPDAEVARQVDTPLEATDAAVTPANVDTEGHADGVKEGTETDPLKARAVDLYRARIAAWFQRGFRCPELGLAEEEVKKLRVGATVTVSADGVVASYRMGTSGNAAVDAAARARLDAAVGQSIPPPPENYPDIQVKQQPITLVCK